MDTARHHQTAGGRRTHRRSWFGLLAIAVAALLSVASQVLAQDGDTATISGQVLDEKGQPLEGIFVGADADGSGSGSARTATDGTYAIDDLRPDVGYRVQFVDEDGVYASVYLGDVAVPDASSVVVAPATGVDAVMPVGVSISGTITDADTELAVSGAQVEAQLPGGSNYWGMGQSFWTGLDGTFQVTGLHEGEEYRLRVSDPSGDYRSAYVPGVYEQAEADLLTAPRTGVTMALEPAASISGTVTDAITGDPVEGVTLAATPVGGGAWQYGYTDGQGDYDIGGLEPGGDYRIRTVWSAGNYATMWYPDATTSSGAEVVTAPRTNINLALLEAATISGVVTDQDNEPIEDVRVQAGLPDGSGFSVRTDELGRYRFERLVPGAEYLVGFWLAPDDGWWSLLGYYDGVASEAEATPVEAPQEGVNASFDLSTTISGTVTDGTQAALGGIRVTAEPVDGGAARNTTTAADGTYTLIALEAGTDYWIRFRDDDGVVADEYYKNAGTRDGATPVTAPAVGIDAELESTVTIEGRVVDGSGAPLEGIEVDLLPDGSGVSRNATTDGDGDYVASGLRSGVEYRVRFRDPDDAYVTQYHRDVFSWNRADLVEAPRTGIDATLVAASTVSGTVTDTNDQPLSDIEVSANPMDGDGPGAWTTTDDAGQYTLAGLLPGIDYRVSFFDPEDRYQQRYYKDAASWSAATPVVAPDTGIDASLPSTIAIRGTVTDRAGGALQDIQVQARPEGQTWWSRSAWTHQDGTYAVTGLEEGRSYEVRFYDPDGGFLTSYHDDARDPDDASTVPAPADQINAALDEAVTITGTVVAAADSAPLDDIQIAASRVDGLETRVTRSGSDGSYEIRGLETGVEHVIVASDPDGRRYATTTYMPDDEDLQLADVEAPSPAGTVVAPADDIDLALQTLSIAGTVTTLRDATPIPDVEVRAVDGDGQEVATVTTAADGTYLLDGLLGSSSYQVTVTDPDGRVTDGSMSRWLGDRPVTGADFQLKERATVELEFDPDSAVTGQPLSLTAVVSGSFTDPGTGTVSFRTADGDELGESAVMWATSSSVLTLPDGFDPGSFEIVASFGGTSWHAEAEGRATLAVERAATEVDLDIDPGTTVDAGDTFSLSATVQVLEPGAGTPTGQVVLIVDGEEQQRRTTAEGLATFDDLELPPGRWLIEVGYEGDDRFRSSATEQLEVVVRSAVEITVTTDPAPSVTGQSVDLQVQVTGEVADVPSGTVTLSRDSVEFEDLVLDADGSATTNVTIDEATSTTFEVDYAGDDDHVPGSGSTTHVVDPAATSLELTVAPQELDEGETLDATASLTVDAPGAGDPRGEVALYVDAVEVRRIAVDAGTVTFEDVLLDPGMRTLTASYLGGDDHLPSDADDRTVTVRWATQVAGTAPTSTVVGQPAEIAVEVASVRDGGPVPAGEVVLTIDGEEFDRLELDGGTAVLTAPSPAAGTRDLEVVYLGDEVHVESEVRFDHEVLPAATALSLAGPEEATVDESGTYTAEITVLEPGAGAPSGTVELRAGAEAITDAELQGSTVAFEVSFSDAGERDLVAHYLGSDDHEASSSEALTVGVQPDVAELTTSLQVQPDRGVAPLQVDLVLEAESSDGQPVDYRIDTGDDRAELTGSIAAGDGPLTLERVFEEVGTFQVVATFESGGTTSGEQRTVRVLDPAADGLELAVAVEPARGPAPLAPSVTVDAFDPQGAELTYRLEPGDGSPPVTGEVPSGEFEVSHIYQDRGRYPLTISVTDGSREVTEHRWVTVDEAEAPRATAGDDRVVVQGDEVVFDAAGSRPTNGIDEHQWDLGDGSVAQGDRVTHTYLEPGTYEVELTVRVDGESSTDTATVRVLPPPEPETGLLVTVKGAGTALAGASVLVMLDDGAVVSGTTDGAGQVRLHGIPDGPRAVYAVAPNYLPEVIETELVDGSGEVLLPLEVGEFGAATLDWDRLSYQEIIDAGIDPDDPDNQFVYEADIWLYFEPREPEEDETIKMYFNGAGGWWFGGGGGGGGSGGGLAPGCGSDANASDGTWCMSCGQAYWYPTVEFVDGEPIIHWLVIPMRASFLKEFFEVSMVVQNLATGFTFSEGTAELSLPEGLSLAPTGTPQAEEVDLPAIPGGSSETATWIVRGDEEGEYDLAADYRAELEPFGLPVLLEARTRDPLKVWGGSAVRLIVEPDDRAIRWGPYEIFVTMENVSDIDVYNPTVALLDRPDDAPPEHAEYVYAPGVVQEQGVPALAPGSSFRGEWVLFPGLGNDEFPEMYLVEERSFISQTGGNVSLDVSLEPKERRLAGTVMSTPVVEVTQNPGWGTDTVRVSWEPPGVPVGGVTAGYEVYVREDLTSGSDWELLAEVPASEDPHVEIGTDQRFVGRYYAVVTILEDGSPQYAHNLGVGPARYVALGDGMSSGEGVPAYFLGTAADVRPVSEWQEDRFPHDNLCHRSQRGAFPTILANDPELRWLLEPFDFAACSGAFTRDMEVANAANEGEAAQLDRVSEFTDVVTVTFGQEDAAFYELLGICVIQDCLLDEFVDGYLLGEFVVGSGPWAEEVAVLLEAYAYLDDLGSNIGSLVTGATSCGALYTGPIAVYKCAKGVRAAQKLASTAADGVPDLYRTASLAYAYGDQGVLRQRLEGVYDQLAARAPNAVVYVPLYPDIAAARAGDDLCPVVPGVSDVFSLSTNEVMALQRLNDEINRSIREAVRTVNAGTGGGRFQVVEADFQDRQLCLNGELNQNTAFNGIVSEYSIVPGTQGPFAHSYTVNAQGHQVLADAVRERIQGAKRVQQQVERGVATSVGSIEVSEQDAGVSAVGFAKDGTAEVALIAPDGGAHTAGGSAVTLAEVDDGTVLRIDDPQPGTWQIEVTLGGVGDGDQVEARAWTDAGAPPSLPVAVAEILVDDEDPTVVTLDGSGSAMGQAPLATYRWMLDDGRLLHGATVSVELDDDARLSATLTVIDEDGRSSSADVSHTPGSGDDAPDEPGDDPGDGSDDGPGDGSGDGSDDDPGDDAGDGSDGSGGSDPDAGGDGSAGGGDGAGAPGDGDSEPDGTTSEGDGEIDGADEPPEQTYQDVPDGSQHADAIRRMSELGVTLGCGDGRYCPDGPVQRDQMASFLVRAFGLPESSERPFGDVEVGSTHESAINALAASGVTVGCDDGSYCPGDPVSRDQTATFLSRVLQLPQPSEPIWFDDVGDDHPHRDGIQALAHAGITLGCGDGQGFCPDEPVTRAQMATFLDRSLEP